LQALAGFGRAVSGRGPSRAGPKSSLTHHIRFERLHYSAGVVGGMGQRSKEPVPAQSATGLDSMQSAQTGIYEPSPSALPARGSHGCMATRKERNVCSPLLACMGCYPAARKTGAWTQSSLAKVRLAIFDKAVNAGGTKIRLVRTGPAFWGRPCTSVCLEPSAVRGS
jgi:hypothetical protein